MALSWGPCEHSGLNTGSTVQHKETVDQEKVAVADLLGPQVSAVKFDVVGGLDDDFVVVVVSETRHLSAPKFVK